MGKNAKIAAAALAAAFAAGAMPVAAQSEMHEARELSMRVLERNACIAQEFIAAAQRASYALSARERMIGRRGVVLSDFMARNETMKNSMHQGLSALQLRSDEPTADEQKMLGAFTAPRVHGRLVDEARTLASQGYIKVDADLAASRCGIGIELMISRCLSKGHDVPYLNLERR